jgi:hypothetical protein
LANTLKDRACARLTEERRVRTRRIQPDAGVFLRHF